MEKGCQKVPKNDLKIETLALLGRIFEILGGFGRGLIFNEFSIGKKLSENLENGGFEVRKAKFRKGSAAEVVPGEAFGV